MTRCVVIELQQTVGEACVSVRAALLWISFDIKLLIILGGNVMISRERL